MRNVSVTYSMSFVELRTTHDVSGVPTVHDTFEDACRALGLLEGNAMARELLHESVCYDTPRTTRSLCAQLMLDAIGPTGIARTLAALVFLAFAIGSAARMRE